MECNIKFNPESQDDIENLLRMVLAYPGAEESYKSIVQKTDSLRNEIKDLKSNLAEKEKEIGQLNGDKKAIQIKLEQNSSTINNLQIEISEAQKRVEALNGTIAEKIGEIDQLKEQINEYEEQLKEKSSEIEGLLQNKKRLEERVNISDIEQGVNSEPKYFKVAGTQLKCITLSRKALYVAKQKGDLFEYVINTDGPIMVACQELETQIRPFCDIINSVESPNDIHVESSGTIRCTGYDTYEVETRAKVSLRKI